jgi:hypothetical protein
MYLRHLLAGERPHTDVKDAEIQATAEYRSYMDSAFVWQWQLRVTDVEAIAACRLILADLASGQRISWPGDARKYIYAVKAIDGMKAATTTEASTPTDDGTCDMGPVCEMQPPDAEPEVPGPWRPEPEPDRPRPDRPKRETDPPDRRIVTPTIDPPPKDEETWRKRIEDAERWVEDLKRRGAKLADEAERHARRARRLFEEATALFVAGVIIVFVPGSGPAVLADLAEELDEIDRLREQLPEYGPKDAPERLGIKRKERHHVFPQEHRPWFVDHDNFPIDEYTIELDDADHDAIHLTKRSWRRCRTARGGRAASSRMRRSFERVA